MEQFLLRIMVFHLILSHLIYLIFLFQGGKKNKKQAGGNNTVSGGRGEFKIIEQLLTDPAALEAARQERLMLAATRSRDAASEAYLRSLSASVNKPSRAEEFPYVFDSMAELFATYAGVDRSKVSTSM